MTISYIVATSVEDARREAHRTFSRMVCGSRDEALKLAGQINAEHGYDGYYRVFREVVQEEVAA